MSESTATTSADEVNVVNDVMREAREEKVERFVKIDEFQGVENFQWKAPVSLPRNGKSLHFVDASSEHPLRSLNTSIQQSASDLAASPAPLFTPITPFTPFQPNSSVAAAAAAAVGVIGETDPFANVDPLTGALLGDPLSSPNTTTTTNPSVSITGQINRSISWRTYQSFLQWSVKSNFILKKYTTNKNIPIISNIQDLTGDDDVAPDADLEGGVEPLGAITLEDRIKMRLESLKVKENSTLLTQTEYIKHLEVLNNELSQAWNKANDRVKSLRIVIKCAKMLGRNTVPQCYPSIFVLVSRVLDNFGQLVSERIKNRSTIRDEKGKLISKLPKVFTAQDVPEEAKEVCRNWFYKISSIRELIARIYVEMAIVSSNSFLVDSKEIICSHFRRLSRSIRGIGDPLAAAYARCYLARKIVDLYPEETDLFMELLADFFESKKQMESESFLLYLEKNEMDMDTYLDLFQPAVEWLMEAIGANSTLSNFNTILQMYINSNLKQASILESIIRAFDPLVVASFSTVLLNQIFEAKGCTPQYKALQALGEKFAQVPPKGVDQMQLLNTIWSHIAEVNIMKDYMRLAEVYSEYVSKAFSQKEVNVILKHVHGRVEPISSDNSLMEELEETLEGVLLNVMENMSDFVQAFNMEYFLPIFDLLKSTSRVRVSKGILSAFSRREGSISDPVILNSLYDLARSVHDSINELSPKESKDDVCVLLEEFISRVDFGSQLDKQLNFYMDCRRSFAYFDRIKRLLSAKVLSMCMRALYAVKRVHNRKSVNFAKASIAFCHITIPSIHDPIIRLRLYLQSAEVCVSNNLFSQAETFLELVINDFAKLTPTLYNEEQNIVLSIETELVDILSTMASLLVAVPGHPERGPFVILQQYLKVIQEFKWESGSNSRSILLCRVLRMLFTLMRESPPYAISQDFCNADLFVVDSKYFGTVQGFINGVIQLILQDLQRMTEDADASSARKRAEVAIDLVNSISSYPLLDPQLGPVLKKSLDIALHTSYSEYSAITARDLLKYGSEEKKSYISKAQVLNL